jgi:TetR/AcrR family transcriptional regulator, transcriptional repressor for nem operon
MAPATASAEKTRRRILDTAFNEFYHNGFQGGSINRIVTEASITKGALFHHFKGKNELGYRVIDEMIRPMVEQHWIEPLAESIDPIEDIKALLNQHRPDNKEELCQGCPLNNLAQEMSPLDEGFRERINGIYDDWRKSFAQALTRGIKSGKVRTDVNSEQAAAFVIASMAGIIGTAKTAQSVELLQICAAGLRQYLDSLAP